VRHITFCVAGRPPKLTVVKEQPTICHNSGMDELTTTIDKHGRIVIPAAIRRRIGVKPGDHVVLIAQADQVRIVSQKARREAALRRLRQLVAQPAEGRDLAQELIEDRLRESNGD
jgi:AbrB family looped-hinge helix DNA binding protein